ncbi:MAG: ABC transporter permease [Deltaproteobacteria bacterium]|nr:ABC transporter permease [Deltaproteobacteria bacterium]
MGQNINSISPVASLGRAVTGWVNELGAVAIFFFKAFLTIFRPRQLSAIIQGVLGTTVALSIIRELGPVLAAIMITARAGSSMVTEIGIQRISEQIDALSTMRIDPIRYLISPRIAAAIISFPFLTAMFDLISIMGGYVSGVLLLGLNSGTYFNGVRSGVEMEDITGGLVKSVVFAVLVSTICCFHGYFTHMRKDSYGAKAVGLSTTSAVVLSCVAILVSDYVVTSFLM